MQSLQKIAKITTDTPEKMRSTRQTVIIQILGLIIGIIVAFIYHFFVDTDMYALQYSATFLWIIIVICATYYMVDFYAFKLSLISFRGFVILIAIILNWLCDILRHFIPNKYYNESFIAFMGDNICFTLMVMLMLAADSAPRVINLVRFLLPFFTIVQMTLVMIRDDILDQALDCTIFRLYYGSLTINEMEAAAKLQIIWYGCTFLWAVPRDPKHHYFVFLDNRIKIKTMLPIRKYVDGKRDKLSKSIIHGMSVVGVLITSIYMIGVAWRHYNDVAVSLGIIYIILVVMLLLFTAILMYKHFEWFMVKQLVLQFRVNMLISCILILIYCAIQEFLWKDANDMNVKFVIENLLNNIVFAIACFLAIIRDGLNISYPNYMVILFSILLFIVSCWNVLLFTFGPESIKYPAWFKLIQKQAYSQVIVISYLWLYYLWRDRDGVYFSLIRKRKETHDLWGDTDPMSNVRESFDVTNDHQKDLLNNDNDLQYDLHQQL